MPNNNGCLDTILTSNAFKIGVILSTLMALVIFVTGKEHLGDWVGWISDRATSTPGVVAQLTVTTMPEPTQIPISTNASPTLLPALTNTSPPLPSNTSLPTSSPSDELNPWACVDLAKATGKWEWETCWRYAKIIDQDRAIAAPRERADAIEWIGPRELTYTSIGQYNLKYPSEWYIWALDNKQVRFCIDADSKADVANGREAVKAGCHTWTRGPFEILKRTP